MDKLKSVLKNQYDVNTTDILPQKGGWASLAYRVSNRNQSYFLKVYEKDRASTPKLTALIDHYMPVILWLWHKNHLKGKISVPFLTNSGQYKSEDEYGVYLLYDYIEGETVGKRDLSEVQARQLAKIITELHAYGEDVPVRTDTIREDFDVPFLQSLQQLLHTEKDRFPFNVWELINPFIPHLKNLMHTVEDLSQHLKKCDLPMALCHTDLHNWNLMQSGQQLMVIDWEGLKLAPVEADLMFIVGKPYFNEFLSIYRETHRNFEIDSYALQFYQNRRRLEDIWEFIEQLLYDDQSDQERAVTMNYLREELKEVNE